METILTFRPHFKTHQSDEIGKLYRAKGVTKIAVSSVSMARFFASDGWNDITIAFPVNLAETNDLDKLVSDINLNLLVESAYSTRFLAAHLTSDVGIYIKIDTGYHRTGIDVQNTDDIECHHTTHSIVGKLTF